MAVFEREMRVTARTQLFDGPTKTGEMITLRPTEHVCVPACREDAHVASALRLELFYGPEGGPLREKSVYRVRFVEEG